MRKKRSILKLIISVSGIIIFAKILGFVKQMLIAQKFGATTGTDIVLLSQGIITDFEYLLSQTMLTAFVPIYISVKADENKDENVFTGNVCSLFSIIIILISIALFFLAPIVAKILAPSYTTSEAVLLVKYIRIYATIPVVLFLMSLFNALLKANEYFTPGELISVNQSIIYIVVLSLLSKMLGVDALVIAFFLYAIANLIYLMFCSRNLWYGPRFSYSHDKDIAQLFKMVGPLLLGLSTIYINQQVDRMLATGLGEGAVTALSYGAVLSNLITGFIGSICGIVFTYVAKFVSDNKDESAAKLIQDMMIVFITILIPVTLVTVFNSNDIVKVVFGRGKFDLNAVEKASQALIGYGFVFISYVIRELLTRLQYSYKESKKPMLNSVISIIFNVFLSIALSKSLGILGITIASSVSVLICAILNVISSRKHNKYLSINAFIKPIIYWGIGTMGIIVCFFVLKNITVECMPVIRLIIVSIGGMIVYFIIELPLIWKYLNKYNSTRKIL